MSDIPGIVLRAWRRGWHRGVVAMIGISSLLVAQESRVDPLAGVRPAMAEMRAGTWDAGNTRAVIDQLLKSDHAAAANWWASEADAAIKAGRLPATVQAMVSATRKTTAALGATDAERLSAGKLVRHVDALVIDKNYDEARKVSLLVDTLLAVVPDPAWCRTFDEIKKRLGDRKGDNDAPNLQRREREMVEVERAARQTIAARIDRFLLEEEAAGCRAGRLAIRACLASCAQSGDAAANTQRIARLNTLARGIERPRLLRLALGTLGVVTVFRDGTPLMVRGGTNAVPPVCADATELRVIDCDLIQLVLPPYNPPDSTHEAFWALGVAATLDGAAVPAKAWFRNAAGKADAVEPTLVALSPMVCTRDPAVCRSFGIEPFPEGEFVFRSKGGFEITGLDAKIADIEANFATLKMTPLWFGLLAPHCVAVLIVPATD